MKLSPHPPGSKKSITRVVFPDSAVPVDLRLGNREYQMFVDVKLRGGSQIGAKSVDATVPVRNIDVPRRVPALKIPPTVTLARQFDETLVHDPLHYNGCTGFCFRAIFRSLTQFCSLGPDSGPSSNIIDLCNGSSRVSGFQIGLGSQQLNISIAQYPFVVDGSTVKTRQLVDAIWLVVLLENPAIKAILGIDKDTDPWIIPKLT